MKNSFKIAILEKTRPAHIETPGNVAQGSPITNAAIKFLGPQEDQLKTDLAQNKGEDAKRIFFSGTCKPDLVQFSGVPECKGYRVDGGNALLETINSALREKTSVIRDCLINYSNDLKLAGQLEKIICKI
ncbi:MAG: hypothetical protein ACLPX5_13265 [Dissulfurispiraceae bacterium]